MEFPKQDNKENIAPFSSSKQFTNPVLQFHSKSFKCRKISSRKPLQDITHLFDSSLLLEVSRSEALITYTSVSELNLRRRKSAIDVHSKNKAISKSIRMNFR
ncbi:unnamed protein product [Amaranthus hypochondriacus]